jgi:hypothetical protein
MNEESSFNPSEEPDPPETDTDIVSLLKRMQQQLNFLEKKIDILISQSQEKTFGEKPFPNRSFQKRPFSKPLHSFDRSQRHSRGDHEHSPRDRDSAQGRFYERRKPENKRSPNAKRKPYYPQRKDRE